MRLRGRKGILEALQLQPELVVLEAEAHKGRWRDFFGNDHPIHVELGMGKGIFISEMSVRNPNINFIGVDRYDELVRRAGEKAKHLWHERHGEEPKNLALARFNIEHLEDMFTDSEVECFYLNFSDPWPKNRHARRRLTHKSFLDKYRSILNERGEIHLKTDAASLFEFSLNSFADEGLRMRNITFDLHRDGILPERVMTEYEAKFVSKGMPIYRCEVVVGRVALDGQ
ncbi:MAG: tRNA (guanosine(46)-N7)-methyltransferase TrmB [Paenibacillaceae bacterium]